MKIEKTILSAVMREIGRGSWSKAGKASAAKLSKRQRSERALRAVMAREAKREGIKNS